MSGAGLKSDELPRLSRASLDLDPVLRLQEAARNAAYVADNIGEYGTPAEEHRRRNEVTPVHEAGHAVAFTLAGREVLEVSFKPFGQGHLGNCRVKGDGHVDAIALSHTIGIHGMARELVGCFAGPVAELRLNPRRVFSGLESDRTTAESVCQWAEFAGAGNREVWRGAGWAEACRMFCNEAVWRATLEIAERLKSSAAAHPRVSGGAVRSIVARHLPGGWIWSGIFARR